MSLNLTVPFDYLPDDAFVRIPIAQALTGKCRTSLYELAKSGNGPPIIKIGNSRCSGQRAGELRKYLRDPANYKAA